MAVQRDVLLLVSTSHPKQIRAELQYCSLKLSVNLVDQQIRGVSKRKPVPRLKGLRSLAKATPYRGWIDRTFAAFQFP